MKSQFTDDHKRICVDCMIQHGFKWSDSDEGPSMQCPVSKMYRHVIGEIFRYTLKIDHGIYPPNCLYSAEHAVLLK